MKVNFEEYQLKIRKRNRVRYFTLLFYVVLILLYIVFWQLTEFESFKLVGYLILTFGGFFFILFMIIYPYFRPIETPVVEDGKIIDLSENYLQKTYYEEVVITILYYLTLPFTIIYGIISIWMLIQRIFDQALIFAGAASFFLTILALFDRLILIGDENHLLIKFGPFKEKLELNKVISTRPVAIKPLKTYLGYGKRIGTDGSIGYITGASTGVKLDMREKRKYVISTNDPKTFVNYIRTMKSLPNKSA